MDPWELVADPLGSAEHTLRTTVLEQAETELLLRRRIQILVGQWMWVITQGQIYRPYSPQGNGILA
jgi:hypothetical protein